MMAILDISIVAWKQRQARLDGERESYDGELLEKVKRRLRVRARQLRNRGAVRETLADDRVLAPVSWRVVGLGSGYLV